MRDVLIIGGGPSGLNAARKLAQGGLDVVVLERKNQIGTNVVCTGIVGEEAFREFELPEDSICKDIQEVKLISPRSTEITYQHPFSFAHVVNREAFDKNLAVAARSKGVEINLDNYVLDISVRPSSVDVLAKIESKYLKKYSARMAIIATGIDFSLSKKLGLGYPKNFIHGIQAEFECGDWDLTTILVGNETAPGAFAWVVPTDNKTVRVGLMTEKKPLLCFQNIMKKLNLTLEQNIRGSEIQFRAITQGLVSRTYGERVLAVGEAAGQVKTTSGGGIYFGLLCSDIASRVVLKRFDEGCFSALVLAEYEKLWKKAIQKEILIGYYARKICGKLTDTQIERLFRIAQTDGIIPLVREKGNFDWHSELILALIKKVPLLSNLIHLT
ncbi:MAG: geranylgeranyl reductase family protein [Candidatus Aminicenantes bacterium]|nr:geranylgeranyl reductase family protein [Candidatus Aminicenantes bacterium]